MGNSLIPLHYAIVKHFMDGCQDCASGVVSALKADYGSYKMLTLKDVEEALATAKENGVLEECGYDLDSNGGLVVYYRMTDFGKDMVGRFIP